MKVWSGVFVYGRGMCHLWVWLSCLPVHLQKLLVKESAIVSLNEEVKKLKAVGKEADKGWYKLLLECC